jgi:hypothetical protein
MYLPNHWLPMVLMATEELSWCWVHVECTGNRGCRPSACFTGPVHGINLVLAQRVAAVQPSGRSSVMQAAP